MPDITDPAVIAFYSENFTKEKKLRLKWFFRNLESIRESATLKNDIVSSETVALLDKFKGEMSDLKVTKKPEKNIVPLYELAKFDSYVPMKPVEPEINNLLYSSTIGEGRKNYLRKRFKMNPEDKFYFPETSSWVYGWELKKSKPTPTKRNPRVEIVRHTFYRKSGVGSDPDHYKQPAVTKTNICFS